MFAVSARHTMANARPVQVTVPEVEAVKTVAPIIGIKEARDRKAVQAMTAPQWLRDLVFSIAEKHGIDASLIVGRDRRRFVVAARNEVFYLARFHVLPSGTPSFPNIARWFGREHTAVIFGAARHAYLNDLPPVSTMDVATRIERCRVNANKSWKRRFPNGRGGA